MGKTSSRGHSAPKVYRRLNVERFGGRLPKYRFVKRGGAKAMTTAGAGITATAGTDHRSKVIFLPPGPCTDVLVRHLIHEMCHVETRTAARLHGEEWCASLRRAAAGEPWLQDELNSYCMRYPRFPIPVLDPDPVLRDAVREVMKKHTGWAWRCARRFLTELMDCRLEDFERCHPKAFDLWQEERDRCRSPVLAKVVSQQFSLAQDVGGSLQ